MPSLSLSVLGPFEANLGDRSLGRFRTRSAQALLIYLACQPDQAHQREHLMALLWPGLPQKSAQASLRQALYLLRKTIPELDASDGLGQVPFLTADRQTIQVNPSASVDLDAITLERLLARPIEGWSEAITLYRGDFLADFYLPDSAPFEEWVLARREALRRMVLNTLEILTGRAIESAGYATAESHARRQIEIDNLRESGHRQLIETLALSGRRTEALAHYDTFRLLLEKEFAAEPSVETVELYERVLADKLAVSAQPATASRKQAVKSLRLPPFLQEGTAAEQVPSVFVSRESELNWLDEQFDFAHQGQGRVAFVSGDAGSGKSTLLKAFARQASEAHDGLLVAWGSCNAFSGRGDPYLPFRDVLSALTGDVENAWSAGTLNTEQARTIWRAMPAAIQALLDHGPDLLDTLVPKTSLLSRAEKAFPAGDPLLGRLKKQTATPPATGDMEQSQLFEQATTVLRHLSTRQPIVITLDDLHWADSGSINLLFHLGRRLAGTRVLLVGAYREDELTSGQRDKRHPLLPLLEEFKSIHGDIFLDLSQEKNRSFVDQFLDSQPNRLDDSFRKTLFAHTGGHPLFTVELLRDMQERGALRLDADGKCVQGSDLDWSVLPARVEGVIESRIGRLEEELRDILTVAAVEGEDFTAQVVARVQQLQERLLLHTLSSELSRRHRLVVESSTRRFGRLLLSRYRFAHALFQRYLYNELSAGERQMLHGEIADILEELYAERLDEITVQLAWHYAEAGEDDKALPYLLQAGDSARALYAFAEAALLYEKALIIYKDQGDYDRASRMLMKLGLTYHSAFDYERSSQAYEEGFIRLQQSSLKLSPSHLITAQHPLRILSEDVLTFDPGRHNDYVTSDIIVQLFSGLIDVTPDMNVVPEVARSWEVLNDGQTYLFHLRDDVRWSDGEPVTAHDFVVGWRRALDPENGSPAAPNLYDVRGAAAFHQGETADMEKLGLRALDDWTLQIDLEQPSSYFLYLLDNGEAYPVPGHVVSSIGDAWADPDKFVSNGPFRLESYKKGDLMVLRRNPSYHGNFRGNIESIHIDLLTEKLADLDHFLPIYDKDEFDVLDIEQLPPVERQRAIQEHATDYVTSPGSGTIHVGFDVSRPPFDDPRVRRAFALATDRQRLVAVAEKGHFTPATGGLIPLGIPGHVPGIALRFDLEQARRCLAEAGFPGGQGFPNVTAVLPGNYGARFVESVIDPWCNRLGVEINPESVDWSGLSERIRTNRPHILITSWLLDYPDPDNMMRLGKENATNWRDRAYDRLVEQARRVMDHDERMRLYRQAEKILVREAPIFPLYYNRRHLLVKPWIRNYRPRVIGSEAWKDVIIDPY